jgi:hypothetical protein
MKTQKAIEFIKMLNCINCDFKDECETCSYGIAIECMEKQIPKKPIAKETKYTTISLCPICESTEIDDYCEKCGQALKWGEEDE